MSPPVALGPRSSHPEENHGATRRNGRSGALITLRSKGTAMQPAAAAALPASHAARAPRVTPGSAIGAGDNFRSNSKFRLKVAVLVRPRFRPSESRRDTTGDGQSQNTFPRNWEPAEVEPASGASPLAGALRASRQLLRHRALLSPRALLPAATRRPHQPGPGRLSSAPLSS